MVQAEGDTMEAENERLRAQVQGMREQNRALAARCERLLFENEQLSERTREAQTQMRLMRRSTTWRLGGVLRAGRRSAGVIARNARAILKKDGE